MPAVWHTSKHAAAFLVHVGYMQLLKKIECNEPGVFASLDLSAVLYFELLLSIENPLPLV